MARRKGIKSITRKMASSRAKLLKYKRDYYKKSKAEYKKMAKYKTAWVKRSRVFRRGLGLRFTRFPTGKRRPKYTYRWGREF